MAKLYFRFGAMNCGKSSQLLQVAHNYEEKGKTVIVMKPSSDKKGNRCVVSRAMTDGREVDYLVSPEENIFNIIDNLLSIMFQSVNIIPTKDIVRETLLENGIDLDDFNEIYPLILTGLEKKGLKIINNANIVARDLLACILVDEAQFLTREQVEDLFRISKEKDIPVICYGLLSDFKRELFPGSERLVVLADEREELITICDCGNRARFNSRYLDGEFVLDGPQVSIDGIDSTYNSQCPTCRLESERKLKLIRVDNK